MRDAGLSVREVRQGRNGAEGVLRTPDEEVLVCEDGLDSGVELCRADGLEQATVHVQRL